VLRSKRLEIEKAVDELKADEAALKDQILNMLTDQKLEKSGGREATASITRNLVPQVKDWPAFHKYILKTKSFDLLEKRASKSACVARWEEGVELPGVEQFTVVGLSLTKAGGK
jgi:hypothetical protein